MAATISASDAYFSYKINALETCFQTESNTMAYNMRLLVYFHITLIVLCVANSVPLPEDTSSVGPREEANLSKVQVPKIQCDGLEEFFKLCDQSSDTQKSEVSSEETGNADRQSRAAEGSDISKLKRSLVIEDNSPESPEEIKRELTEDGSKSAESDEPTRNSRNIDPKDIPELRKREATDSGTVLGSDESNSSSSNCSSSSSSSGGDSDSNSNSEESNGKSKKVKRDLGEIAGEGQRNTNTNPNTNTDSNTKAGFNQGAAAAAAISGRKRSIPPGVNKNDDDGNDPDDDDDLQGENKAQRKRDTTEAMKKDTKPVSETTKKLERRRRGDEKPTGAEIEQPAAPALDSTTIDSTTSKTVQPQMESNRRKRQEGDDDDDDDDDDADDDDDGDEDSGR